MRSACWSAMGYTVAHNKPYAGGFITEHYGRPAKGLHALQIEVNRGLYMNERTFQKSVGFRRAGRGFGALRRRSDGDARDIHFTGFRWPRNNQRKRCGLKKDRIVCTTRSKSREETPKEGMDRNNLSDCTIYCALHKCQSSAAFLIHSYVPIRVDALDQQRSGHHRNSATTWIVQRAFSARSPKLRPAETLPRFRAAGCGRPTS